MPPPRVQMHGARRPEDACTREERRSTGAARHTVSRVARRTAPRPVHDCAVGRAARPRRRHDPRRAFRGARRAEGARGARRTEGVRRSAPRVAMRRAFTAVGTRRRLRRSARGGRSRGRRAGRAFGAQRRGLRCGGRSRRGAGRACAAVRAAGCDAEGVRGARRGEGVRGAKRGEGVRGARRAGGRSRRSARGGVRGAQRAGAASGVPTQTTTSRQSGVSISALAASTVQSSTG